ncbi:replication restart helicase PriA [Alicyclobacillus vulcanalis]|uniref:Replication restart protein PriA n=1 Tax=Alicyclobacillus vulcanalis TaxID=252246 RepID=A0A1N7NR46_9BACL|nr:primosomal protein N' [Alicyclobacillus vulcanalis]SIT00787.1 replication restart DNA helicase PriA [Alicyclobacillus vulcanalis]
MTARTIRVAEVVVDGTALFLDKRFSYAVPPGVDVAPGMRVVVPMRSSMRSGIVWALREASGATDLRPLARVVDRAPVLTSDQMRMAEWLCDRYAATLPEAVSAILPGAFRLRVRSVLVPAAGAEIPDDVRGLALFQHIAEAEPALSDIRAKSRHDERMVRAWMTAGFLREEIRVDEAVGEKRQAYLVGSAPADVLRREAEARRRRARRQSDCLEVLADVGEVAWDKRLYPPASVQPLVAAGLVRVEERRASHRWAAGEELERWPELTPYQARAVRDLAEMADQGHGVALLHGVTGSGKTEVYMHLIRRAIEDGGQALVLVPEIALTPQLVRRFERRFGGQVAVLHSGLSLGERREEWTRVLDGDASVVIGARSAVFAPMRALKLVVIDEEHEPSYKQEDAPHYDAREVAMWRAKQAGALVILGSATPSLSSMYRVEQGSAKLVSLPVRANQRPLPPIEIIDMREELRTGNRSIFSRRLAAELEATVSRDMQAILFLNRRGFAHAALCRACGHSMECPRCDIHLTVHRSAEGHVLVCHYCGHEEPLARRCPDCGEEALMPYGLGTEQVEEHLRRAWPSMRVLRMDLDTTRRKGSLQAIIERFQAGEADVLVGTQMIAKGLDFPRVRLVGVVAADAMLTLPDYRANERAFQLLTQVAGRAGRAETDGITLIQTYQPGHRAVEAAKQHDYRLFYERERESRAFFRYPPFCELAVFLASHSEERLARGAAARFERELGRSPSARSLVVLPAGPSGIRRIDNVYRYQVVMKYAAWQDVKEDVVRAYRLVKEKMNRLGGSAVLDVNAQRIG